MRSLYIWRLQPAIWLNVERPGALSRGEPTKMTRVGLEPTTKGLRVPCSAKLS